MKAATIVCPGRAGPGATSVTAIFPSGTAIPYNQLRLYVQFSAAMSEGAAADHVHLLDDASGRQLENALLPMEPELWDRDRRRLTVLLDPARLKRGLLPHQQAGYPLQPGAAVRVVVHPELPDAGGRPLRGRFEHRYQVGPDVRDHVTPGRWDLAPPAPGPASRSSSTSTDRSITGCSGGASPSPPVRAGGCPGRRRSARGAVVGLRPRSPWPGGRYQLIVDPRLEDLAGNSVARVFDRDLRLPRDDPRPARPARLPFTVGM